MNKAELTARTATETSLSSADADDAVTPVFSTIDDALASGEAVRAAAFGTFSTRSRPSRQSRNSCTRSRASQSTPPSLLPSREARPSASPSTTGFGEREYCSRSLQNPIRRPVGSRRNQTARAFAANVADLQRPDQGHFTISVGPKTNDYPPLSHPRSRVSSTLQRRDNARSHRPPQGNGSQSPLINRDDDAHRWAALDHVPVTHSRPLNRIGTLICPIPVTLMIRYRR